jgi:septation ring formation regulator EzrA
MDLERRMDRVERRLDATLKIVQTGMKMLVKMEKENSEFRKETREFAAETREAIHALIESQMRTDATVAKLSTQVKALGIKIDRFVDEFSGGNGSGGRR